MANGSKTYTQALYNKDGYVLLYPNVASGGDLLEDAPIDPFVSTAKQLFPLGAMAQRGAEEIWVYSYAGATQLELGVLTQMMDPSNAASEDNLAVPTGSDIGDYTVYVTSTADIDEAPFSTADGLRGGYIFWNTSTGQGQCRKIKSNTAFATTTTATIELYDPISIALTTSSKCGIIPSPWWGTIAVTQLAAMVTGAPEIVIPTTARYYWSKMRGPIALIQNATIAVGTEVVVGTTTGKVDPRSAYTTELVVGFPLTPAVTTNAHHFMCFLTLL